MRLGRKNNILGATLVVFAAIFALYIFTPNAEAGIRYGIARSACTALGGSVVLPDNGGLQVNCNVLDNPSDPTKAAQNDPGVASIDTGNTDTDFRCNLIIRFPNCVAAMVYWLFPGIGSYLAFIGAYFLGLIVQLSLDSSAYALQFLTDAWTVVRDIANMAFIFILIYIAFEIMLGAETAGTMRRLAWVIAIALIVNFSFFITRVVIDAGNILAVQFYNSIPVPAGTPSIGPGKAKDLSAQIMSAIGVQQLYGAQSFKQAQDAAGGAWRGLLLFSVVSIAFAAVTYVLFFIFIQVGIKFLLRIVALWFVIIASPLALVSKTLKQTESFYKTWQDYLIKFSFYPAIFLFVFILLTTFLTQMNAGQSGNIWSILTNGYGSTINEKGEVSTGIMIAGVLIRMAFVVILLYIGLKVADWVVQEGNGLAQKFTGFVGGAMRGGVGLAFKGGAGIAAFGARQTVGRAAYSAAQSKWAKRFEATNVLGRPLRGALGAVGSAQLDIRNAPGGSILGRGVGKIAGGPISVGKPGFGKGGFAKSVETRAKNVEERAKGLKGNEVDIRKAQAEAEQKFKEEYEKKFGSGSFETNKSKNEKRRDSAREQAEKWEQEIQKARARNDQTSMEFATTQRDETRRMEKSAGDALKQFQVPADAGKKAVEQRNKELITAFAQRIGQRNIQNLGMPSRGSIEGAAKALKLVQEKSKKDKFAEAAKEYAKEVETEEGVGPEETPPTGGGAGRGTGGAGTSTATGTGTTGSGSSGGPSALNLSGATAASKALE